MKNFFEWYKKHITGAIFVGLILGILTGLLLAGRFEVVLTTTSVLGSIYMNALNMMIFPLVFCSIVMGIASIGSAKTTGKITGAAMLFFLCTPAICIGRRQYAAGSGICTDHGIYTDCYRRKR